MGDLELRAQRGIAGDLGVGLGQSLDLPWEMAWLGAVAGLGVAA